MKTNKEYDKLASELVYVLNQRDEVLKYLRWCLKQMPNPSLPGAYADDHMKAWQAAGLGKEST